MNVVHIGCHKLRKQFLLNKEIRGLWLIDPHSLFLSPSQNQNKGKTENENIINNQILVMSLSQLNRVYYKDKIFVTYLQYYLSQL